LPYNVYPAVSPTSIAGAGSSGFIPFAQFALGEFDPPDANGRVSFFIRVLQLGGGAAAPSLSLRHVNGPNTVTVSPTVGGGNTTFFFSDATQGVASAIAVLGQPVYRIQLAIPTGKVGVGTWSLQIGNNNAGAHEYMWVVGSNNAQSQQPWLFIDSGAGDFFALTGCQVMVNDSDSVDIVLRNYGTAAINLNGGGANVVLGNFTVTSVPTTIPIGGSDTVTVVFNAPATPGISSQTWDVDYVHTAAGADSPAPQDSVGLSARHARVEVVYVADASGSMARTPEGTIPGAGESSRWQLMVDAVGNLMGALVGFAEGSGTTRVLMFPDITGITPGGPPADALTQLLIFSGDIQAGLPADVDAAFAPFLPLPGMAGTAIIEAVIAAMENHFDTDPTAVQRNRRTLVLLTDGSNTHGRPPSTLQPGGSHAGQLAARNITVVGVAYGRDDVTDPFHVDHALVADIAAQTAGGTSIIASDETTTSLNQAFTKAAAAGLCVSVPIDPSGLLTDRVRHAYHAVCIGRHDRRVGFVINWARNASEPIVELRRPDGVVITEKDADLDPDITYDRGPQRKNLTLQPKYLGDPNDPANTRYGTWTLHVFIGDKGKPPIPYEWGVLADSGARLQVEVADETVFAGEPIEVSARFTVNGLPVVNAAITLRATVPTESRVNLLARAQLSEDVKKRAREELAGEDVTGIGIKARAAVIGKVKFPDKGETERVISVPLKDTGGGVYRATLPNTAVQGRYELAVTGLTDLDGCCVHREHHRTVKVRPRPEPELSALAFQTEFEGNIAVTTISVTPQDRFGNLVLIDPAVDDFVAITADDREVRFRGPLVTDFDGTYRRVVEHEPDRPARIDVRVGEVLLFDDVRVPVEQKLSWMERVVQFDRGKEAQPGINQHANPEHALGSAFGKKEFLSLGAAGVVILGAKELIFRPRELVVFVESDVELRAYQIDVLAGVRDQKPTWLTLGKSKGLTERFPMPPLTARTAVVSPVVSPALSPALSSLGRLGTVARPAATVQPAAGQPAAWAGLAQPRELLGSRLAIPVLGWSVHAVRIIDLSLDMHGAASQPSATPGVSIRGVGYVPW
jgi:hypothetical protein